MAVLTGIDVLRRDDFAALKGKRIGLLTNPSAVDRDLTSTYTLLRQAPAVWLAALFSPEHGFAAVAADGEHVASSIDPRTGLPIHSLYGPTQRPTPEMLAGLDAIVVDIQDIGVRYYTFVWTLSHVLEAAGEQGVAVIVLDRPNPLGDRVAGAPLDARFASLVGRYPVPTQHGMTLGELARLFNSVWNSTPAPLTVIACEGYRRDMEWPETGLPFVPPSPNMPHLVTAQHYPGSCLIEGTTLSEGRGTALPFEVVGAPGLEGEPLADAVNGRGLPGVRFRPYAFKPTASKYAGDVCAGVQAHITAARAYRPLETWLVVLQEIYRQQPFEWNAHFERLMGSADIRPLIENGSLLDQRFEQWEAFCTDFRTLRNPYLLYH
jgi:uncharacterized protein YbbC (DUF1343 family)